jgi:hypothetical protein
MRLLLWIIQFACGRHHRRVSGVFTIKKRTYQVCLECGQEFPYSWELLHSVRSSAADDVYAPPKRTRQADVSVA